MNEAMVTEYFKAVGAMGKFDSVNISALLTLLNKQNGVENGGQVRECNGHVSYLKRPACSVYHNTTQLSC